MGGLLLTLFHHPPSATKRLLTVLLQSIDRSIAFLLPSEIAALFGDPVLAQVFLEFHRFSSVEQLCLSVL